MNCQDIFILVCKWNRGLFNKTKFKRTLFWYSIALFFKSRLFNRGQPDFQNNTRFFCILSHFSLYPDSSIEARRTSLASRSYYLTRIYGLPSGRHLCENVHTPDRPTSVLKKGPSVDLSVCPYVCLHTFILCLSVRLCVRSFFSPAFSQQVGSLAKNTKFVFFFFAPVDSPAKNRFNANFKLLHF